MPIVWIFFQKYWKQCVIGVAGTILVLFLRAHWINLGESKINAQLSKMRDHVAQLQVDATLKQTTTEKQLTELTQARDAALAEVAKKPAILTKIITKVMHEGETCTDHDIGPDFERLWNDAAKASHSNKPVP